METEDSVDCPTSGCGNGDNELHSSEHGHMQANSSAWNATEKEDILNRENHQHNVSDAGNEDTRILDMDIDNDVVGNPSIVQVSVELTGTVTVAGNFNSRASSENGCLAVSDESCIGDKKIDTISGVKRARMTYDEEKPPVHVDEQPSVHVMYNSLTRASKRKLEELLQEWSEWHAKHGPSSQDPNEVLETGEETYFPALHFGIDKSSAVSFWIENQPNKQHCKEFVPLDSNSVPLYDRGYALGLTSADGLSNAEGGLEIVDDVSRCFNCGSYTHPLKDCPKPRDNVAVSNARKNHKSRRNQNLWSRNPSRYYQNTPGGKYDGLRPGALDGETRKLLGIGDLDPPPWLNRMREMGYPPGYLEDEDQPSGITIFADEEAKEEQEDGEIIETEHPKPPRETQRKISAETEKSEAQRKMAAETEKPEPQRKMTVEFPGINVPIPENADEKRWAAGSSSSDFSRNQSHRRSTIHSSSEPISRGHPREQRLSRDFRDDGPPGCDPGTSPYMSSYSPRYGGYDSNHISYSPRSNIPMHESPVFGRSASDRGRWSPHDSYGSLQYSALDEYSSARSRNWTDDNDPYFSPRTDGLHDGHRHRSRR